MGQGHGAGDNAFHGSRDAAGGHAHHARRVPAGRRRLVRLAGSLPWPQLKPRTAGSCSQRPCLAGPQPGPNSLLGPLHPQVWCGPHAACTSRPGCPRPGPPPCLQSSPSAPAPARSPVGGPVELRVHDGWVHAGPVGGGGQVVLVDTVLQAVGDAAWQVQQREERQCRVTRLRPGTQEGTAVAGASCRIPAAGPPSLLLSSPSVWMRSPCSSENPPRPEQCPQLPSGPPICQAYGFQGAAKAQPGVQAQPGF